MAPRNELSYIKSAILSPNKVTIDFFCVQFIHMCPKFQKSAIWRSHTDFL